MERPSIIFIQSDSMDGRAMGCAGLAAASTPVMDALAARGALFRNAYCNSPQCCPSRASMWSGRYVHSVAAWNNYKGIESDTPTFQTALDARGYRTAVLGRTDHLSGSHSLSCRLAIWTRSADIALPAKHPPQAVLEEDDTPRLRAVDWEHVDEAVAWLHGEAGADERPFFMHLGFLLPHPGSGFRTNRLYRDRIDPAKVTVPSLDTSNHPAMAYMRATKNCAADLSDDEVRAIRRHYYAMIAELDAMVGAVLRAANDAALLDSTYVIYTSDHGEMNMEHGQYLKNALYEPSARVPLIIAGPGIERGAVREELVSLVDIFPTLMDMASLDHPTGLAGHSLLSTAPRSDAVLAEYHANMQNTGSFMLRRGPWKYIAYPGYEPQLFNLDDDPDEIADLAATRPQVRAEMDAALRGIVDYEAVDARVKAYDRAGFRQWRAAVGETAYREHMLKMFRGWGDAEFARIEAWMR